MSILEMQVEALMRLCTAGDEETKEEAKAQVLHLLRGRNVSAAPDPEPSCGRSCWSWGRRTIFWGVPT